MDQFEIGDLVIIISQTKPIFYKRVGIVSECFYDSWELMYNIKFGLNPDDNHWYKDQHLIKIDSKQIGKIEIKEV